MLDTPQILQTPTQPIAVIHLTVPQSEIRQVMGPGIGELMAAVAAQGIALTGPWFTHHRKRPADVFDFEIGVPVASPATAAGRMKPSERPAMVVARAVYHGPYEGLAAAWGEFDAWVKASGRTPTVDLWETYVAGPETGPDSAAWTTELVQPLID